MEFHTEGVITTSNGRCSMDNLLFRFAMLLWITGIIFYCILFPIATKKCFFGKTTIWKSIRNVIVCIFLMPMVVYEYSNGLSVFLTKFFHIPDQSATAYMLSTICEVVFIILAIYLYILYFKPVDKTKAVFVYLMVNVITFLPSSLPPMEAEPENAVQIIGESLIILALGYVFYRYLIVPVSKITQIDNKISRRAYIVLPMFSFVYTLIMTAINSMNQENKLLLRVTAISSIFVILVVCIGFCYIIQNTIVINELEKARDDVKTLSVEVMEALACTIDAKDQYTKGHSVRVAKYARMIAEKMGLSAVDCENIYYMGLLHDIGKVGVPDEIINKQNFLMKNIISLNYIR